ncbi:MAG TPA: hypothetical protein VHA33_09175 [Candidatus Angelobacter sp.]|jgi:hypothetical protein|nr:hypothetical protein [Candidatus Angelobacter sp.]
MFNAFHKDLWSKVEVTDLPTGRHGVYESTEADKHAPLSLGAAAAGQIGGSISGQTAEAAQALDERLSTPKTTTSTTPVAPETLPFKERLASFQAPKPVPSPPSISSPAPTRGIGVAMTSVLDQPQTWMTEGSQTLKRGSGRCFSFTAMVVFTIAGKTRSKIEVFGSTKFDHYFVVVGRTSKSRKMAEWGDDAVVIDAWQANLEHRTSACYKPSNYIYGSGLKRICVIQE